LSPLSNSVATETQAWACHAVYTRSPTHGAMVSSPAAHVGDFHAGLQLRVHVGHVLRDAFDEKVPDPGTQGPANQANKLIPGFQTSWLSIQRLPDYVCRVLCIPARAADCTSSCLLSHVVIAPTPSSQKAILERRAPDGVCRGSDEACTQGNPPSALGLFRQCLQPTPRCCSAYAGSAHVLVKHAGTCNALTPGQICIGVTDLPRTAATRRAHTRWSGPSAARATDEIALLRHPP